MPGKFTQMALQHVFMKQRQRSAIEESRRQQASSDALDIILDRTSKGLSAPSELFKALDPSIRKGVEQISTDVSPRIQFQNVRRGSSWFLQTAAPCCTYGEVSPTDSKSESTARIGVRVMT